MNARAAIAPLATLLLAWLAWEAAGWLVATFGLAHGALLQQAALLALALTMAERLLARFQPPGDSHE